MLKDYLIFQAVRPKAVIDSLPGHGRGKQRYLQRSLFDFLVTFQLKLATGLVFCHLVRQLTFPCMALEVASPGKNEQLPYDPH